MLLTGGLVALLVPLIQGQDAGWPTWTYLTLGAAVVLLLGFAAWEVGYARRGGDALVPPRLFTHLAFSGGVGLAVVYFAAFTSIFFVLSILWQAGLGHTALDTGIMLVPFALGSIVAWPELCSWRTASNARSRLVVLSRALASRSTAAGELLMPSSPCSW